MKGVVLAAGEGLRCRPLTLTRSKVMLPVANKPILEYVVNALVENGIKDIILVVGYQKNKIMDYFGDGVSFNASITYVDQEAQLGTAHAVAMVRDRVDGKFLVVNGDNLVEGSTIRSLLEAGDDFALLSVPREHPAGYGVVVVEKGRVVRIVEKPHEAISNLLNTGIYLFSPRIFEEIDQTPVSEGGEKLITDTLAGMISRGVEIRNVTTSSLWADAVHSWDLLKLNAMMLERVKEAADTGRHRGCKVEGSLTGKVSIGEGTVIHGGTHILGPAVIGENCEIGPNVVILPSTSIGDNVFIGPFSEIENSIIMDGVQIASHAYISNSIVGKNNVLGPGFVTEVGRDLKIEMKDILHHAEVLGTVMGDCSKIGARVLVRGGKMIGSCCNVASGVVVNTDLAEGSTVI